MTFLNHKTKTHTKATQDVKLQEADQLKQDIKTLLDAGFILGCMSHDSTRARQEAWSAVIKLKEKYSQPCL
jgi:ribulose bisphosphate carboxylase small subunit